MNLFGSTGNIKSEIQFFSVSADFGSTGIKGAQSAPEVIRLLSQISGHSSDIIDLENNRHLFSLNQINDLGNLKYDPTKSTESFLKAVELTSDLALANGKLFSLGGDHLITLPILKSAVKRYKNLQVIHFDAHFDQREISDNSIPSHNNFVNFIINDANIQKWLFLGQRGFGKAMPKQNEKSRHINLNTLLDNISPNNPVYITLDLDVINCLEFSSVNFPRPGRGLYFEEIINSIVQLKNLGCNVIGIDICEYNPKLDMETYMNGRMVVDLMAKIIAELKDI